MSDGRPRALITGASSGIGEEFARQLSAQGYDLILVARRETLLKSIAADFESAHGIEVEVLPADLAQEDGIERVSARIAALERIDMLVNCAGFGMRGWFTEREFAPYQTMLHVHVEATARLTHATLPAMRRQGNGAVINVSSIAAFVRHGGSTMYSSTKAFINSLSTNLQGELKGEGIRVQALCPGYTYSGFHDTEEYADFSRSSIPAALWLTAEQVVRESLQALKGNKVIVVPGLRYRFIVWTLSSPLGALAVRIRNRMRGH